MTGIVLTVCAINGFSRVLPGADDGAARVVSNTSDRSDGSIVAALQSRSSHTVIRVYSDGFMRVNDGPEQGVSEQTAHLACHPVCAAISPDGRTVALGETRGVVTLLRVDSLRATQRWKLPQSKVSNITALAFSCEKALVVGDADGTIFGCHLDGKEERFQPVAKVEAMVSRLVFHPESRNLYAAVTRDSVAMCHFSQRAVSLRFPLPSLPIIGADWCTSSQFAVVQGEKARITRIDMRTRLSTCLGEALPDGKAEKGVVPFEAAVCAVLDSKSTVMMCDVTKREISTWSVQVSSLDTRAGWLTYTTREWQSKPPRLVPKKGATKETPKIQVKKRATTIEKTDDGNDHNNDDADDNYDDSDGDKEHADVNIESRHNDSSKHSSVHSFAHSSGPLGARLDVHHDANPSIRGSRTGSRTGSHMGNHSHIGNNVDSQMSDGHMSDRLSGHMSAQSGDQGGFYERPRPRHHVSVMRSASHDTAADANGIEKHNYTVADTNASHDRRSIDGVSSDASWDQLRQDMRAEMRALHLDMVQHFHSMVFL
ncbi:MAG: hypothetical protein MHM6MM_001963 [Cercozoa sp. M6MM]